MGRTKDEDGPGEEPLVGYLSIVALSGELFRGGLLITDVKGKPRDFRCTSAIKPNAIQRVLYGGTLAEHLALDLCGLPLLGALPKPPAVLLADSPDVLSLRPQGGIPMLWLRRQSQVGPAASGGLAGEAAELVASEAGLFDTVLASCHAGHGDDMPDAVELVRQVALSIDPLEPFSRIAAALKLVQDKAGAR